MAFDPSRPDAERCTKVGLGEWLAVDDPVDTGRCDPWDVRHRMALYRLLVERTNARGALGERDELSPFWGFATQLAWQHRSGRTSRDGASSTRIDTHGWWGICNYALSIVPYAAAMQIGAVPVLHLEEPAGEFFLGRVYTREGTVVPAPTYAAAFAAWRDALGAMVRLARGDDIEPVRFAVWRAHLASIEAAVRAHRCELGRMHASEARFGRGWVRMVDLLGTAAARVDLAELADRGAGSLPSRMLSDTKLDNRHERSAARRIIRLGEVPSWAWRLQLDGWRRMMRTRAAREEYGTLLRGLFGLGSDVWTIRRRALGLVLG